MATIVFVDDQIELYAGQIEVLRSQGHDVRSANGDVAFRNILTSLRSIDLLITDFMCGSGAVMYRLAYLKDFCGGKGLEVPPVIVLTSTPAIYVLSECANQRVQDVLTAIVSKEGMVRVNFDTKWINHIPELTKRVDELLAS